MIKMIMIELILDLDIYCQSLIMNVTAMILNYGL